MNQVCYKNTIQVSVMIKLLLTTFTLLFCLTCKSEQIMKARNKWLVANMLTPTDSQYLQESGAKEEPRFSAAM